ncbi:uncharacterized protein LOC103936665 [Pyrus x bretschneideri]|uniref:uncharacterized protein LOC103936665 n=1 Tax=Pyrus x bretschneideri TaxID=225117 RepID=UPI00202F845F|nr:uncharacterized protein LOC103936665 [Pyrus x bretschneideri]
MASDESMTIRSCISMQEDEYDDGDTDEGYDHHYSHPHNLSRLSMCTRSRSSTYYDYDDDQDIIIADEEEVATYALDYYHQGQQHQDQTHARQQGMTMQMSLLSIETLDDGYVDDEEDDTSYHKRPKQVLPEAGLSSDSDGEPGCYSLPATPPRRRRTQAAAAAPGQLFSYKHPNPFLVKEYASENEDQTATSHHPKRSRRRTSRRRIVRNRHSWLSASPDRGTLATKKDENDEEEDNTESMKMMMMRMCNISNHQQQLDHYHSFSGESDQGGTSGPGTGVVVITRPKGGRRSLCMDLDEVKACRDLGFELEHHQMLHETPSRLSRSASTLDTNTTCSSGANSPIANWRISSPGDDPREVKARLKVWAQAVALASTSRPGS